MNIIIAQKDSDQLDFEFVERKGKGHPDTLSDGLAEYLSAKYSAFTREKFGAVLHHNFDKVGLLGGASDVGFGYGFLVKPIRVLLNGRASSKFGDNIIPVEELLTQWSIEFLCSQLPIEREDKHFVFHYNLSTQSSPGKTQEETNKNKSARNYWFEPRNLGDLPELTRLFSNDTSMGVGFYPFSLLEKLVLKIEKTLNSDLFGEENKWIGSDIKIMGFRHGLEFNITMCVPQIGSFVSSLEEYKRNIKKVESLIYELALEEKILNLHLYINTRDDYDSGEVYLTAIGSSIESGDEGLVGRGNRVQGMISQMRPMSMEGVAGKNPVYHIGKVYYVAAQQLSEKIYYKFNISNEVALVSQSGRDLLDPWVISVRIPTTFVSIDELRLFIADQIYAIPEITEKLIQQKISIC